MGTGAPTIVSPNGRIGLQLLRVAAICLLVGYHAALIAPYPNSGVMDRIMRRVGSAGWIGTDLFLAIAGFLAFDSRNRCTSQLRWLAWRTVRILPPYWAFLLLYLQVIPSLIGAFGGHAGSLSNYGRLDLALHNQPYLYSMTTNLLFAGGTWIGAALEPLLTIAIGVQLVLLTSVLMPLRRGLGFLWAVCFLECVGIALRFAWRNDLAWRSYSFPLTRCDAFLFGLLAAWALHRETLRHRIVQATPHVTKLGLTAGLVALVITRGLDVESKLSVQIGYPLVGLCFACLVLTTSQAGMVLPPGDKPGKPEWPRLFVWLSKAGALTFAAYLVKLPVMGMGKTMMVSRGVHPTVVLVFVVGVVASFTVGWLWFRIVESSLSRVLSRLVR